MRLSSRFPRPAFLLAAIAMSVAPAGAQITLKDAFPGMTFNRPIWFGEMPGAAPKTYVVVEQHVARIAILKQNGAKWDTTTMFKMAVHQANEMGLLGLAFHPDYKNNKKYYINYNPPGTLFNIVEEREADASLLKDAGKGRILLKVSDKHDNHNGGTMEFGPKDGFLYIGMGDGGSGGDPDGNGQNKNALLGKMLRIDVNKKDAGLEYGIPADNPYAQGGGRAEIWAYGLRNPWKWSFDPVNGDLWLGDVGQETIEEVDLIVKGGNYGWDIAEGNNGNGAGMVAPIHTYGHGNGNNCIIGGVVYRGNPASPYYGTYFFGDLGGKRLWNLKKNAGGSWASTQIASTASAPLESSPTAFGTDASGQIYVMLYKGNSPILRLDSPDLGPAPTSIARTHKPVYRTEWKGMRWEMNGRKAGARRPAK